MALENALPELSTLRPIDAWPIPHRRANRPPPEPEPDSEEGSEVEVESEVPAAAPAGPTDLPDLLRAPSVSPPGLGRRSSVDPERAAARRRRPMIGRLPVPEVITVNACHVARAVLETRPYQVRPSKTAFALHDVRTVPVGPRVRCTLGMHAVSPAVSHILRLCYSHLTGLSLVGRDLRADA